ncbi:unnamed protein product [Rotaria sp. Silwood1]|nr:unnamed protein product [Rotaria sp. Silwood1]
MASMEQELLPFLENISSYSDDIFYKFVREFVGIIESEILEIQRIKNVRILLQVPDVFLFFQINSKDILKLKEKACFVTDDLQFIVRPGIKSNIEQFIETLRKYYESTSANVNYVSSQRTSNVIKKTDHCMCDLIDIYQENQSKSFINIFVSNLLKNMKRSSNNYQFDDTVNKFASVLHILAGHNAYEFIRLNLPGSLPSITTLKTYNQNINLQLRECEFRFDCLKDHLELIDSNHVFLSEDSTGVIISVSYDSRNDCFIGFSPRLVNGLPFVDHFKTNRYTELQQWFEDFDKSTLVNAHLVEPLLSNSSSLVHSRPFILSAYGTNNKYTAIDILRKWMYLYNECKKRNINVVGFSTDCDPRYLKAMQLSLGFFTKAPNIDLLTGNNNLLEINIASHWNFFFIRSTQPYLCMQDAETDILTRLYYGWVVTFSYRMWWSSIQIKQNCSQKEKDNCFVARAAWLSSELNVHCLTAIIMLVSEGRLPSYAVNTHLFSNQPCEATFRSARALTGTLSTIKSTDEANCAAHSLKFPVHHKNRHRETTMSANTPITSTITTDDIEKIIIKAYHQAESIMDSLQLTKTLKENNLNGFRKLNDFVFRQLTGKLKVDYSYFNEEDLQDSLDNDNNSNGEIAVELSETNVEANEYCSDEDEENNYPITSSKEIFQGMRVYDEIDPSKKSHYFPITINYKPKFIHKQTAARLLTIEKNRLSSDRQTRVQQISKQR